MAPRDTLSDDDEDEDRKPRASVLFEFDCPSCNANNPWPDGFRDREEISCHYCGVTFRVSLLEGKLKLKEQ